MKILSNKIQGNYTEIIVEADKKAWVDQQEKAFKNLASKLNIQGFRKGHIPLQVAKSKITEPEIINQAINPMIDELYRDINASKDFEKKNVIIDALNVDVKKVDKNSLEVLFKFENYPTIETPDIKSLKVKYNLPKVDSKEVDSEISRLSKNDWMLGVKESGIIANGDMANIDFEGFLDDKPFAGGTAKSFDLEIGSGSFIPGFEEQLVGLKKGDKKDIFVTFPENYHEKSLAGKKTKFAITVNEIKEITKPTMDAEYIKKFNFPNVNTLDELRKHISLQILEMKKLQARDQVVPLISQELIEKTKVSYFPESLIKDEKNRIMTDIQNKASQAKKTTEEYIQQNLGFKDLIEFNKNVNETANKNLTLVLSIEKLIEILKIEVTEKDLNDYFEKVAKYYGAPVDQIKKQFANRKEGLKVFLSQQKLFDEIIKQISSK